MVFSSAAFNDSLQGQYEFSEVFAKDVVGMQKLREQDSIKLGQDLSRNI